MKTVLVAMSGGVDSSVSAYLLKKQGYNVVGVTMALTNYENKDSRRSCCSEKDRYLARYVAAQIDIPFEIVDYRETFKKEVTLPFIESYRRAETPNPCVLCNSRMKFSHLLNFSERYGADYIATGHYAKIVKYDNRLFVKKGVDSKKDQSYFLYKLTEPVIERVLFPIGDLHKTEVREIAKSAGLITDNKPESQEICFVDTDYRGFISDRIESKAGFLIDEGGNILGKHKGIENFTIGQRKGINLSFPYPVYVKKIDPVSKNVTVANRSKIVVKNFYIKDYIFKNDRPHFDALVKIRSQSIDIESELQLRNGRIKVSSEKGFWGVAPGQSAVAYIDDRIVAGGIITDSSKMS